MEFFKYFAENYMEVRFGISFILTDVFFVLGLVIVFGEKIRCDSASHFWTDFGIRTAQTFATWALGILLCCFFYWVTGYRQAYNLQIAIPTQIVFFALIFNRSRYIIKAVLGLFYYSVFACSLSFSAWVGSGIRESIPNVSNTIPVAAVVQAMFIALCVVLALLSRIKKFEKIDTVSGLLLLLVSASNAAISLIGRSLGAYDDVWILSITGLLFTELIVFFMFRRNTRHTNELLYLHAVEERNAKMTEIAEVVRADIDKLKAVRHDLKNSYAYMKMLLDEGKYDELGEYFKKNTNELYDCVTFAVCGNFVIDHILTIEKSKAKPKNIAIEYNISVAPVLVVEDSDLCHLLLNLIDNAIEAIERENFEGDKRKVFVNMNQNGNIVFVKVENAAPSGYGEGSIEKFNSSKDGEFHGYGMKIVRRTVKKYNGTIRYTVNDGMFCAEAVLFMDMQAAQSKSA